MGPRRMTDRDMWTAELRETDLAPVELRSALCQVVMSCGRPGLVVLRDVVLGDERVFYIDEPTRNAS